MSLWHSLSHKFLIYLKKQANLLLNRSYDAYSRVLVVVNPAALVLELIVPCYCWRPAPPKRVCNTLLKGVDLSLELGGVGRGGISLADVSLIFRSSSAEEIKSVVGVDKKI